MGIILKKEEGNTENTPQEVVITNFATFFLVSLFPESFHLRQKENKAFVFERYFFSRL